MGSKTITSALTLLITFLFGMCVDHFVTRGKAYQIEDLKDLLREYGTNPNASLNLTLDPVTDELKFNVVMVSRLPNKNCSI
jgi:hypothetical protein